MKTSSLAALRLEPGLDGRHAAAFADDCSGRDHTGGTIAGRRAGGVLGGAVTHGNGGAIIGGALLAAWPATPSRATWTARTGPMPPAPMTTASTAGSGAAMSGTAAPTTAISSPTANITGARACAAISPRWSIAEAGNSTATARPAAAAMAVGIPVVSLLLFSRLSPVIPVRFADAGDSRGFMGNELRNHWRGKSGADNLRDFSQWPNPGQSASAAASTAPIALEQMQAFHAEDRPGGSFAGCARR